MLTFAEILPERSSLKISYETLHSCLEHKCSLHRDMLFSSEQSYSFDCVAFVAGSCISIDAGEGAGAAPSSGFMLLKRSISILREDLQQDFSTIHSGRTVKGVMEREGLLGRR